MNSTKEKRKKETSIFCEGTVHNIADKNKYPRSSIDQGIGSARRNKTHKGTVVKIKGRYIIRITKGRCQRFGSGKKSHIRYRAEASIVKIEKIHRCYNKRKNNKQQTKTKKPCPTF
jgi:hypothetical protein